MIIAKVKDRAVLQKLRWLAVQVSPEKRAVVNRMLSIQMQGWVLRNFKTEGKLAGGSGWAPLALSTIIGRARRIRGKRKRAEVRRLYRSGMSRTQVAQQGGKLSFGRFPILQDTGSLRASFLPFSDANEAGVGAMSYISRGRKAPADLAKIHEFGTNTIPQRRMLPNRRQALDMGVRVYRVAVERITRGRDA